MQVFVLKMRDRGRITLPKRLCEALHLENSGMVRATQIGNSIVLTPQRKELDALRKQCRGLMKRHNVSSKKLLRGL